MGQRGDTPCGTRLREQISRLVRRPGADDQDVCPRLFACKLCGLGRCLSTVRLRDILTLPSSGVALWLIPNVS